MLFPATLLLPVMAVLAEVSIGTLPAEKGSCDLLDGVFVSVMRRIFSPGFHKVNYRRPCYILLTYLPRSWCQRWS